MRESLMAEVSEIEPSADAASRTFRVRLDLPEGAGVRAGMFGRVTLPAGESERLTVPALAVERRGQMELVWVVEDGRAALRLIRTGRSWGEDTEVLSGLKAGERVVVGASLGIREGQPVVEVR
jgi:RND family efflux transporter MFP subunit